MDPLLFVHTWKNVEIIDQVYINSNTWESIIGKSTGRMRFFNFYLFSGLRTTPQNMDLVENEMFILIAILVENKLSGKSLFCN